MSQTVSDSHLSRLTEWGVKRIYGFPGDGINGIMGALKRAHHHLQILAPLERPAAGDTGA